MKRLNAILLLLAGSIFTSCCPCKSAVKSDHSKHVIGYQVQEMIRASDSSRYYDTIGTFYYIDDTLILEEKPYSKYE